jgi:P4 family phage/plasmid primase-like protien
MKMLLTIKMVNNQEKENLKTIKKNLTTPVLFKKTEHHNKACFSYNYKQYGSLETWGLAWEKLKELPVNENVFHELMMPDRKVKPYLDVEWIAEKFPHLMPDKVLLDLKEMIIEIFKNEWNAVVSYRDIYVASCHRKVTAGFKNSFRIIISTHPSYVFNNTNCASYLAKRIKKLCVGRFDEEIIDGGVYHKLQNMRLIGHCKAGEYIPMMKTNSADDDKEFIITNVDPEFLVLETPEQKDNKYTSIKNTEGIDFDNPEIVKYVMDKIRSVHPSSTIERIDANKFIQLNYTDRTEPCFCRDGVTHDRIGFFCFIQKGQIYIGCHSGNCVDGENKKITKILGSLSAIKHIQYEAVSFEDDPLVEMNDVKTFVYDGSFGMSNMLKKIYLEPVKRVKWINDTTNGGSTFYWDGKLWKQDEYSFLERLITSVSVRVLRKFLADSAQIDDHSVLDVDEGVIKTATKLSNKLNEGTNLSNIIKFLKPLVNDADFMKIKDIHPYFLSCKNGVVDLKTGILRDCVPTDNITKSLDVVYDPTARTEEFDTFVKQITSDINGEDVSLYNYIKWMIGYSLQGSPIKKTFFILYGPFGYNGKSMLLNIIKDVLGFYAVTMDKSVIINGPQKSGGSHSTEIIQLENSRFGMLTETSEGAIINDAQVKILTGITDKLSAREIYGKQREFSPTFVPIISSNHKMKINLKDKAMYERCILIPFRLSFLENPSSDKVHEKQGDPFLAEKFSKNKEGILKWLVECSLFYHENKDLEVPETIIQAKKEYKREMDDYADFLERYVEHTNNNRDKISLESLTSMFKEFANDNRIPYDRRKAEKMLIDSLGLTGSQQITPNMKFSGYKFIEEVQE